MEECIEKIRKLQELDTDTCIIFRYLVKDYGRDEVEKCFKEYFGERYGKELIKECKEELEIENLLDNY